MSNGSVDKDGAIRVLLVEDHALVRGAIRALLERGPRIRVIGEAESAAEALEFLGQNPTDVVVTDIRLKGSSGVALTAAIEKRCPGTKTLVLTAYAYDQYFRATRKAGAEGYLLKQATMDELLGAIIDIHEDRLVFPKTMTGTLRRFSEDITQREYATARDLTPREVEILELLDLFFSPLKIASRLGLSRKTVYTHLGHIQAKMGGRALVQPQNEMQPVPAGNDPSHDPARAGNH